MTELSTPSRTISSRGTWRAYTTAEGLAALRVSDIVQDHEGYLWIGAGDGLY